MKITLAQISPKLNRENLKTHLEIISKHKKSSDLIIFPELSLNGYLLMDLVFEDAFELNELDELKEASFDIDILIGLALREESKIYNSSIYFKNGKIEHIHNKTTLPNYGMFEEARYFFKGEGIESFKIDNIKATTLICEDLWNSENIDRVVKLNPDIVFVLANSPARGFEKELDIEQKWESLLKTLSILTGSYVLFVNRVGFEDGVGFWGGSSVIAPTSKTIKKAKLFDGEIFTVRIEPELVQKEKYFLRG